MDNCLFCRIADGEIPAEIVSEDDDLLAFRDVNPQAPTHVLVIPRRHIATTNDLAAGDDAIVGRMVRTAGEIAASEGIAEDGYRMVLNCNERAGQSVFHIHLHMLGGRAMRWPPG